MSQHTKLQQNGSAPPANEPSPPYRQVYTWLFQVWLVMALGVICVALVFYLLSYIPK